MLFSYVVASGYGVGKMPRANVAARWVASYLSMFLAAWLAIYKAHNRLPFTRRFDAVGHGLVPNLKTWNGTTVAVAVKSLIYIELYPVCLKCMPLSFS